MTKISKIPNTFFLAWLFSIRGFNIKQPQRAAHLFALMAYSLSSFLALTVIGGTKMFFARAENPGTELQFLNQEFLRQYTQKNGYLSYSQIDSQNAASINLQAFLHLYLDLSTIACVISLLPIVALGISATKMGMSGRSERSALLLQLGYSTAKVHRILLLETAMISSLGYLLGSLGYLCSLPLWQYVKFQKTQIQSSEMLLAFPYWIIGWGIILLLSQTSALLGIITSQGSIRLRRKARLWWLPLLIGILLMFSLPAVFGVLLGFSTNRSHYYLSFILSIAAFSFLTIIIYLIGPVWILFLSNVWKKLPGRHSFLASRRLRQNYAQHWRSISPMILALLIFLFSLGQTYLSTGYVIDWKSQLIFDDIFTGSIIVMVITVLTATAAVILNLANQIFRTKAQIKTLHQLGLSHRKRLSIQLLEYLVPVVISTAVSFLPILLFSTSIIDSTTPINLSVLFGYSAVVLAMIYLVLILANLCVNPLAKRLTIAYQFRE